MPSDVKTPLPTSSGSPSPPRSPSKVSYHHPRSPVFEQGGPSRKAPVIDMSSFLDEEDFFADTSRDFEFAQRLYGELNHDFLVPPNDGKIIILSDSDEEREEVREEKSTGAEDVATSVAVNPASTASADDVGAPAEKSLIPAASPTDTDEDPVAAPNDSSDGLAPTSKMGKDNDDGDKTGVP
jgi:hypothetical protein